MHNDKSSPLLGLAMAAALALPAQLVGQDRPQQQQQQQQACTAQAQPMQLRAGGEAERLTVTLNQPGAQITGLEVPEGSNIELASASSIPRSPLAGADQPRPEPIGQGEAENQWVVYLNLSDAEPGTHELHFTIQTSGQMEQPGQPGQPGQPDRPGQPGQPGQPDQPDRPGQPGQPGAGQQASTLTQCTARITIQQ